MKEYWANHKDKILKNVKDTVITSLWIILIAVLVRSLVVSPFRVPSGSMKPTLLEGDFILVNKFEYGYSKYSFPFNSVPLPNKILSKVPERGDVVVFRPPNNPYLHFVKRVIGLPGESVQVKKGVLYINGEPSKLEELDDFVDIDRYGNATVISQYEESINDSTPHHNILLQLPNSSFENTNIFHIPDQYVFVMGDNRDASRDSRFRDVGFIPLENIIGKASYIVISNKNPHKSILDFSLRSGRFFLSLGSKN